MKGSKTRQRNSTVLMIIFKLPNFLFNLKEWLCREITEVTFAADIELKFHSTQYE